MTPTLQTRWLQYNEQTELICTPGEKDQSKLEPEDFGSFQYWRDPVPTLDLESLLVEVQQQETSVVKTVDQELEALASHLESGLSIDSVSGPTDGNLETANEQVTSKYYYIVFCPLCTTSHWSDDNVAVPW